MKIYRWLGLSLALLIFTTSADGVIMAKFSLSDIMKVSTYVVMAKVESFEPQNKRMILKFTDDIQGKPVFREVPVIMEGDDEGKKEGHIPLLMERLAVNLPIVMFIVHDKENKKIISHAFTNGTWFTLKGKTSGDTAGVWDLVHGEPYLRRTYKGTTEQMRKLLTGYLAGKAKLPEYNDKVKPDFGPPIK